MITDSGVLTVPHEDAENKCRSKFNFLINLHFLRMLLVLVLPAILYVLLLPLLEGEGICSSKT